MSLISTVSIRSGWSISRKMLGLGTARMNSAQPSRVLVKSWGTRFIGEPLAIQDDTSQAWAERLDSNAEISTV